MKMLHRLQTANTIRQKEWDTNSAIDLLYRGNELAGEVGEVCNIMKKLDRERLNIRGSRATVAQLAEELADVVICSSLIANAEGIDLSEEYDLYALPRFNNTDVALSVRGNRLMVAAGAVCSLILEAPFKSFVRATLAVRLAKLCGYVRVIANSENINIDQAVTEKFNATTRKVNLTTFM